ncbi:isoflavone reductase family protein [Verticillium alfalfae VaMs.102]|uniref:Isoflavone reductase family protein n=1 Tax=Verticillium alfalfae (strain VaMs.102 / ATCC MYA-4576 / FGSC 10136) TaxID=526221 RepID=C9S5V5_VERA1|nr:isoflavone reductase family protein [Verticillium alfalfae VaMs.102]EEY15094.1 isoflavone reductase family protein [Verticillium alfalfae VaMs.102]
MASFESVLLIGAGGNLGVPVLQAFLDAERYKVSILTRKGSNSVFPEGVKVYKADYADMEELKRAMEGQDVVISMITGLAGGAQNILVDAAIAAGVKRFLPSEFGPPSRDDAFAALNHVVLPLKTATVDYLKTKESQISWTSIVTGAFFDWALDIGFIGFNISTKTAGLIDSGTAVFTSSTLPYISKAIIASLERPDETKNQYVFVGEFNVSQQDILKTLEEVQGEKWSVEHLVSDDMIVSAEKRIAEGDLTAMVDITRAGAMGERGLGDNRPWGLWDEKLGLTRQSLEQAVRESVARTAE